MSRAYSIAVAGLLTTVLGCEARMQSYDTPWSPTRSPVAGGLYTPGRGQLPTSGRGLGEPGLVAGRPTIAAGRMVGDGLKICRTDARPRGWIAVAYVAASGECTRGGSMPMMAVLTRYAGLPPNTILEVCADESVPRGWVRERTKSMDAADSCPGGARDGSTTRRIRRLP